MRSKKKVEYMLTEAIVLAAYSLGRAVSVLSDENQKTMFDEMMLLPRRARDANDVDRAACHTNETRNSVNGDTEEAQEDRDDAAAGGLEALAALHGAGAAGLGGRRGGGCLGRRRAGGGDRKEGEHEDEDLVHEVHLCFGVV